MRKAGIPFVLAIFALSGCSTAEGDNVPAGEPAATAAAPEAPSQAVAEAPRPAPGKAWVIFGADTVVAEVARTPDERAEGLMYREDVPDGTGMLFVFETSEVRSFWMQNTYVALDIAYIGADFVVVDIQQMDALTTDPHESAGPAMFALEVRQGWFEEQGIRAGDRAEIVFGIQ